MKTSCSFLLVLLLSLNVYPAADYTEHYFKFKLQPRPQLDKISQIISLDNVIDGEVYAYANDRELANFEQLGITYESLPHPGDVVRPRMSTAAGVDTDWDVYPTYDAYVAMMNQFEIDYPGLCEIVDIGASVEGRSILFAKISDNVGTEEAEPEVFYSSSMHGDELTGYILSLRLIDSLLTAYATDSRIASLVDNLEIWINPLANPDGAYRSGNHTVAGARRYNSNGVDLNRNYPDPDGGDHPDGNAWQPETIVFMAHADAQSFVLSANHHGGAELINYPWDTWARLHPDNDWFVDICLAWGSSAQANSPAGYLDDFPGGITNGYAWYRVLGGRQDYMNYWHGCREITTELSGVKLLNASLLPAHWDYNKRAMLDFLQNAFYGIRGIVTDQMTTLPVAATIHVLSHDADNSEVKTDPDLGDYYRMLTAGSYDLQYSALGYETTTLNNVSVVDGLATIVDVALVPLSGDPVLAYVSNTAELFGPGTSVSFYVTLVNDGGGNAIGTAGLLQTTDPFVTISAATSSYPTIPGLGGSAESIAEYVIAISPTCPPNYPVAFSLDLTASGGYVETVTFDLVVAPLVEDFESATLALFPWQFGGDADWAITLSNVYEGNFSIRSGFIADNESSDISISVDVAPAGVLRFNYRVSSENTYDFLRFSIDGSASGSWSGEQAWTEVAYAVEAGPHTFTWQYDKDPGVMSGQDRAWLDNIIFPPLVSSLQIVDGSCPDWTVGQTYSHQLTASGALGGTDWSNLNNDLVSSGLSLSSGGNLEGSPASTGPIQFTAHVEDGAGSPTDKLLGLSINALPIIVSESLPEATSGEAYSHQLIVSDGTAPFVWSEVGDALATAALTLIPSGLIAGTPSGNGSLLFSVMVTDAAGANQTKQLTLPIDGGCCVGIVGDVNQDGGYDPTIGDISVLIDMLFISGTPVTCFAEADTNQSGGSDPTADDLTIGDISLLIDHLFISGIPLAECL